MFDRTGEIALALRKSTYDFNDRGHGIGRNVTTEWDLVASVAETVRMMEKVTGSRRQLFKNSTRKKSGRPDLGDRFLNCDTRLRAKEVERHFPLHKVNPLFELFVRHAMELVIGAHDDLKDFDIDVLNGCVGSIRAEAKSKRFKKQLQDHYRSPKKNRVKLAAYVRRVRAAFPSMFGLRIHLGYLPLRRPVLTDRDCKSHRLRFLLLFKKLFPVGLLAGHAWKIDFSLDASFSVHVLILIDGRLEDQVANIVSRLQLLWAVATEGGGSFFDCGGRWPDEYPGVGRICGDHHQSRVSLQKAVTDMTMPACYMKMSARNKDRTFGKGGAAKRAVLSSHATFSWILARAMPLDRLRIRD